MTRIVRHGQLLHRDRFDELAAILRPRGIQCPKILNLHPDVVVDRLAPVLAERAAAALATVEEVALQIADHADEWPEEETTAEQPAPG